MISRDIFESFAKRVLQGTRDPDGKPIRLEYQDAGALPTEPGGTTRGTTKTALIEKLVRLGATDIPGTPRLLMRHRSPTELHQLERTTSRLFRRYEAPLERRLHKATAGMSATPKKVLRAGGRLLIRNPEQIALQPIPVPGISPLALGAKRGLEHAIDKLGI